MTAVSVGIVGYRMGNITSLLNAFAALGVEAFVANVPAELDRASHLVLPGVGAFARGMQNLQSYGFEGPVRSWIASGRPMLGVCVGMQLLGSVGEEHGLTDGLGAIPGRVTALGPPGLRLPHVGWNDTEALRDSDLFGAAAEVNFYYYVHSFHLIPTRNEDVVLRSEYGQRFAAAVQHDNVYGVQFHPEKSQAAGLAVLRRFAELRC